MVMTAIATPEPEDNGYQFIMFDDKFIFLGDINEFLEKNYKKFNKNS